MKIHVDTNGRGIPADDVPSTRLGGLHHRRFRHAVLPAGRLGSLFSLVCACVRTADLRPQNTKNCTRKYPKYALEIALKDVASDLPSLGAVPTGDGGG